MNSIKMPQVLILSWIQHQQVYNNSQMLITQHKFIPLTQMIKRTSLKKTHSAFNYKKIKIQLCFLMDFLPMIIITLVIKISAICFFQIHQNILLCLKSLLNKVVLQQIIPMWRKVILTILILNVKSALTKHIFK